MADEQFHRLLPEEPVATLEDYMLLGGGEGLVAALEKGAEKVIAAVTESGLRGRGGAGFPTGMKWGSVVGAGEEHAAPVYLVINGAEGEPGTYKDRTLISYNPFQVVEGILIAVFATGARGAYIGIKRRFEHEIERLAEAIGAMAAAGWAGADRIEISPGPDEYLFGEEKAMLEVIEGKLPMPRIIAPYQQGLFATMSSPNPTVVNNIETMANVPLIVANGPEWYREVGTETSPGTMLFTLVGDVEAPGVYELPLGTPLRTLVVDIGGADDIKAIYSGTSNAVITPDLLDTPLGFDEFSAEGTGMGSGGFVVYDSSHCIVRVVASLSHFLAIESCGQCNACKLGTGEITELLERIDRGEGTGEDLERVFQRVAVVTDSNRCYLPVGEQLMVGSTIHRFLDEFTAHLGRPCPSSRDVPVPKITSIDHDKAEVLYDPKYHLKQPDWSYAEP